MASRLRHRLERLIYKHSDEPLSPQMRVPLDDTSKPLHYAEPCPDRTRLMTMKDSAELSLMQKKRTILRDTT
jgi:hypothetical protein